ncbi:MAG: DUF4831 family protein, partial [Alistipes sp.]|nr:DUF4831 family protein [Alistipes sp.]
TAALAALSAGAQIAQNQEQQTTLWVSVSVERHQIVAGPYARYAQKYLGAAAPLADKVLHKVVSAKLLDKSEIPAADKTIASTSSFTHMNPAEGFPRLTIDRTSAAAVSLEESARLAAEKIFELRRSRLDLVMGNVGENVFGGGLGSALAELARLEEEYLSLFFGRESVGTDFKQYSVTPTKGRLTYTVCRFSETDGLLPQDDLSGTPMVLELKSTDDDGGSVAVTGTQPKPSSRAVARVVPADMQCRVILDGVELASEQFRIWQLGETVWVNP